MEGRPTLLNYTYRLDKLRHSTTVRTSANPVIITLHHWDGQNMILETENGRVKGKYVRGANLIAQVIDLSLFYYLLNAHGDVVQRVSQSGQAPQYKYDAFGNQRDEVDTDPNPFRYCGKYWDRHAEEYYFRERTYTPSNGRFTSKDPVDSVINMDIDSPEASIEPLSLNYYVYAHNDPVQKKRI